MRVTTNSDKKLVKQIRDKLKSNGGYCPCKIQRSVDNKCMCKEFRDMMENNKSGTCHCGLYYIEKD